MWYCKIRKQETVADKLLSGLVFQKGVPVALRSDNAPELMKGLVKDICNFLSVDQIVTGGGDAHGHGNPPLQMASGHF